MKVLRLILSNWKTQGCAERTHVFGSSYETLGAFEDPNDMPKTIYFQGLEPTNSNIVIIAGDCSKMV